MKDYVECPLLDGKPIEDVDCLENVDIADGMIKEESLPERFKIHKNWREICKECKYHNL